MQRIKRVDENTDNKSTCINANNIRLDRNEDNSITNINATIQAHIQIQGGRTTCVEADRGMCSHG